MSVKQTVLNNTWQADYYMFAALVFMGKSLTGKIEEQNGSFHLTFSRPLPDEIHKIIYAKAIRIESEADLEAMKHGEKGSKKQRVYAIREALDGVVYLFGFGDYVGDEEPDRYVGGLIGIVEGTNPKIVLDNGDVVWGCECWWGPESKFDKEFAGMKIVHVDINEFRALSKGENN